MKYVSQSFASAATMIATIVLSALVPIQAQEIESLRTELPPNIVSAIRSASPVDIFTIGTEPLRQDVIVADKVLFNEGAIAEIANLDSPFLIIMADELLFANAAVGAQIIRPLSVSATIPEKPATPPNPPQAGRDGRHGAAGRKGDDGVTGAVGQTLAIPDIWLITNKVGVQGTTDPTSTTVRLGLHVPGIPGARGGEGGNGGNGQQGGQGRNGETNFGICSSGPGGGGNGGAAGSGGRGGDGGAGGNGGNVFYVGPQHVIDVLQYTSVYNPGANGGAEGLAGSPGQPGRGGSRGSHPGTCSGPGAGSPGAGANPVNLGNGDAGQPGEKGVVRAYIIDNVRAILDSTASASI